MKVFILTIYLPNGKTEMAVATTKEIALRLAEEYARDNWSDPPIEPLATQDEILDAYFDEDQDRSYDFEQVYAHGSDNEIAAMLKARFPWLATDEEAEGADTVQALADWYAELVKACTCGRGEGKHIPNCPAWDAHADNYDEEPAQEIPACEKCGNTTGTCEHAA